MWVSTVFMWLWNLDSTDSALIRLAIVGIAVLTAFLTIVAIWQIPPAENPLAPKTKKDSANGDKTSTASGDASPFATRFGKTVIAGLGGLVATEIGKTLGNQTSSPDSRWFYIVWFVFSFFVLTVVLNGLRAVTEALRAHFAMPYYPPARSHWNAGDYSAAKDDSTTQHHPITEKGKTSRGFWLWLRYWFSPFYWFSRLFHWILSWRVPLVTFLDTLTFLIQGKNQTRTKAFSDQIIDQQKSLLRVADSIRTNLNTLIERRLTIADESTADSPQPGAGAEEQSAAAEPATWAMLLAFVLTALGRRPSPNLKPLAKTGRSPAPAESQGPRVRVNISVLSADQSSVFYISRTPGSALQPFPKQSMAWVCVFTGTIRWFKSKWRDGGNDKTNGEKKDTGPSLYDQLILFDNSDKTIADAQPQLLLKQYYQSRSGEDYQAFIMLPVPYPRRAFGGDYVKGAIHISFNSYKDMETIWDEKNDPKPAQGSKTAPTYTAADEMLATCCKDEEVRAALGIAVAALGELLRGFNEVIFTDYIEPDRTD